MAAKVVLRLNHRGVAQLLKDPKVEAVLMDIGRSIASAAGPGNTVEADPSSPHRARVTVFTETFEAMMREARYRSLTRAVDAGRR